MTTNAFVVHEIADAPAASAAILTEVQKAWGFVPNLHKVLAASPIALEAYSALINEVSATLGAGKSCHSKKN